MAAPARRTAAERAAGKRCGGQSKATLPAFFIFGTSQSPDTAKQPERSFREKKFGLFCSWCARQDLNLQGLPPDSKSGASASCATCAQPLLYRIFGEKASAAAAGRGKNGKTAHEKRRLAPSFLSVVAAAGAERVLPVIVGGIAADPRTAAEPRAAAGAVAAARRTERRTVPAVTAVTGIARIAAAPRGACARARTAAAGTADDEQT